MKFPDVDIVIPTYNWATRLEACLKTIYEQDYNGKLSITVVDGGSIDGTVDIAKKYNCNVLQINHKYPEGKNGLKNYGISHTNSDYICILDGDNIIQTKNYFKFLITPFLEDSSICLSVPKPVIDEKCPPFTNFITLKELIPYENMLKKAIKKPYGYIVQDMWYGIYNSTVIKRECMKKVYGWDKDVMVLRRLRSANLSKGALVPNATYVHDQRSDIFHYMKKIRKRITYFSSFSQKDFEDYYYNIETTKDEATKDNKHEFIGKGELKIIQQSLSMYKKTENPTWLYGLAYPFMLGMVVISTPLNVLKILRKKEFFF